jgi:hypothetical protein
MLIRYAMSNIELELTDGALVSRGRQGSFGIGFADVRAISFTVGTPEKNTHVDMMEVVGSDRRIRLTSRMAHPDGIRESRALYRKFVRTLLKRIAAAGATPKIRVRGYPPVTAQYVRAAGAIGLLLVVPLWMLVEPPDRAGLLCLFFPALLALGAGILMVRDPEQLIDLETALEVAAPPRGAE